jgi:RNA polymerase sigma-70 factor (ECF subfamily)
VESREPIDAPVATEAEAAQPCGGTAAYEANDPRAADLRFVERLVDRDPGAWAMFIERFQRLVLARAVATAGELRQELDDADAEDLCAEVFSQLVADDYAALRRFEGRSTLSTWLCVVTRRIALRRLSNRRRERSLSDGEGQEMALLSGPSHDDPLRRLIDGEDRLLLSAGLQQLSASQRQLITLLYFDGCSYREASQRLQMPINSIGPTLQRIQHKLRVAMKAGEP